MKEKKQLKARNGACDPPGMSRRKRLLAAACICIAACAFLTLGDEEAASGEKITERVWGGAASWGRGPYTGEMMEKTAVLAAAGRMLEGYAEREDREELRKVLGMVREIELDAVWCLAGAYDMLDMEEEAAEAYKRIIQIEKDPERLAAARERELELQELKSEEGKDAP